MRASLKTGQVCNAGSGTGQVGNAGRKTGQVGNAALGKRARSAMRVEPTPEARPKFRTPPPGTWIAPHRPRSRYATACAWRVLPLTCKYRIF